MYNNHKKEEVDITEKELISIARNVTTREGKWLYSWPIGEGIIILKVL